MNFFNNIYLGIYNYFDLIQQTLTQVFMIIIFVFSILAIITIVFIVIRNIHKKGMNDAIAPVLIVALSSCIFMIPISLSANKLIKIGVIKQQKEELTKIQLEIQNKELKNDNLKKEISINTLQKQVNLLKATQVSAMQFEKIAELALIETNINQTKVWYEKCSPLYDGKHLKADYYDDNLLIVNAYDIDAKFGIDFNKIKIRKINDNKIQVAGIEPKYIGSPRNIKNSIIKEIRRNDYLNGRLRESRILQDTGYMNKANELENKYDKKYQESLENMKNWEFLTNAVTSLGQNFIKMVFSPIYSEIEFVEEYDENFIDVSDYIQNEIEKYSTQIKETSDLRPVKMDIIQPEQNNNQGVQNGTRNN